MRSRNNPEVRIHDAQQLLRIAGDVLHDHWMEQVRSHDDAWRTKRAKEARRLAKANAAKANATFGKPALVKPGA